jgi:hypothetical protein
MATPGCKDFQNNFESWMEGELPPDARAHVTDCRSCARLIEDLGSIRLAANEWNASEEPPARLWTSIRTQLVEEGLIHEPQSESAKAGWLQGWFPRLPRPVLAGAYLAALVAIAFSLVGPVTRRVNHHRWAEDMQNSTAMVSAQLDTAEQTTGFADFDPEATASLHQNLAIVDNYISLCEKSVQEDPEDEMARDYLYDAYHQKADLLAQISERGEYGR